MAHFANIDEHGIVTNVIVAEQDFIDSGAVGDPTKWIQTSYNTRAGVHIKGGTPLRKNYAGIGYKYDSEKDAFIPPKPYSSWILDEETCTYCSPVAHPQDGKSYIWNETKQSWDVIPKPYEDWIYDNSGIPIPPIPYPTESTPEKVYRWSQDNKNWLEVPPPHPGWIFDKISNSFVPPIPNPGNIGMWGAKWSFKKNNWIAAGPPYDSWVLNENDDWVAPIPKPNDETPENPYSWNEFDQCWVPFLPK